MPSIKEMQRVGKGWGIKVESIEDIPNLIDACENFCWFNYAKVYREFYERLLECKEREFKIEMAT